MKQYIKPQIKISMFSVESVSTEQATAAISALYAPNIDKFIPNASNSNAVKRNYSFNEAIKFK